MENSIVSQLRGKTVSLLGFGVSNRAVCELLVKNGIFPTVRNEKVVELPQGIKGIFGAEHKNVCEDVVFRSPSFRGDEIKKGSEVYTDISFFLERAKGFKIGITGSDGKTTTTTLIYKMLISDGKKAHLAGNIGVPLASVVDKTTNDSYMAIELSSFQLFDYCPPLDVSVVTSISENHLDWHKSYKEYVLSKSNVAKRAKRQVVNYDIKERALFSGENTTYFSTKSCQHLLGGKESYVYIKDSYVYHNEERLFSVDKITLKGEYNLYNILGAVGALFGIVSLESMKKVAYSYEGTPHRNEHILTQGGVFFVDSSADSTPTRTKTTLGAHQKSKVIAIMGGYDKCLDYTPLNEVAGDLKLIVLFGANKQKIRDSIPSAKRVILVNNIYEATKIAYKEARAGDFVVLTPASASFDMFENYIDRAEKFKDAIRGLGNGEN